MLSPVYFASPLQLVSQDYVETTANVRDIWDARCNVYLWKNAAM